MSYFYQENLVVGYALKEDLFLTWEGRGRSSREDELHRLGHIKSRRRNKKGDIKQDEYHVRSYFERRD